MTLAYPAIILTWRTRELRLLFGMLLHPGVASVIRTSHSGIACLVFSLLLMTCPGRARAVDLIDTLNLGSGFLTGGNNTSVNSEMLAQSFATTSADFRVTEIDLTLFRASGDAGTYSLYIYDANYGSTGPVPSSVVETIFTNQSFNSGTYSIPETATTDGSDVTPITITGLNIVLPSNIYFVVAKYDSGSFSLNWAANNWTSGGTSFFGDPSYNSLYDSNLSKWTDSIADFPSALKVVAVPEPSTWALGALATFSLAATTKRCRRV